MIAYHLNEQQALLVCMFSRTPKAAEVRKEVIDVFMAYRHGHLELSEKGKVELPNFKGHNIRVVTIGDAPWFVAEDVCRSLDLASFKGGFGHHLKVLAEDEVTPISRVGVKLSGPGTAHSRLISESGLYKLIFRSNKPDAEALKGWVTREVLPSIRKNGGYIAGQEKVAKGISPSSTSVR